VKYCGHVWPAMIPQKCGRVRDRREMQTCILPPGHLGLHRSARNITSGDGLCPTHNRPCPWGCEMCCFLEDSEWKEPGDV
jgi:hypothetical protein